MIAISKDCSTISNDWQNGFLTFLPEIQRRLGLAFRYRDAESREEVISDGIALCLTAYRRLHERRRSEAVTGSSLARYAA